MTESRLPFALPTHLLDVVVGESAAILKLLAGKDQALLIRGDALLVLDLGLDIVDGVRGLDLEGDGLARQGLDEAIVQIGQQLEIGTVRRFAVGTYICTI